MTKALDLIKLARETGVISRSGNILKPGNTISKVAEAIGLGRVGGARGKKLAEMKKLLKAPGVAKEADRILAVTNPRVGAGIFSSIAKGLSSVSRPFTSALQGATFGFQSGLDRNAGKGKTKRRAPAKRTVGRSYRKPPTGIVSTPVLYRAMGGGKVTKIVRN